MGDKKLGPLILSISEEIGCTLDGSNCLYTYIPL